MRIEWLNLFLKKGLPGAPGYHGRDGLKGLAGLLGLRGESGSTGPQGVQGETGFPGRFGLKGDFGKQVIENIWMEFQISEFCYNCDILCILQQ